MLYAILIHGKGRTFPPSVLLLLYYFHGVGFSNFVEWDNLGQLFTKSPNDAITVEVDVKIIESSF